MGPAARQGVPILLQILETEDPYIRSFAAQTLTKVGKDDPRVVPALLRAFAQDDIEIRCIGAGALACLKQESATVVPGIVQVLKTYPFKTEKELRLKHGFIRVLNEYGPLAEPALPYLIQLAQDYGEDPSWDGLVKDTLISIGPAAHKAIPGLKELGENPRDFDFYTLIKKLKQN
jgi:hypothetical protein